MESQRVCNKLVDIYSNGSISPFQWRDTIPLLCVNQFAPMALVHSKIFAVAMINNFELFDVQFPDDMMNPYQMNYVSL